MKAVWSGIVVAESNKTMVIEGDHYFPPESINKQYFEESTTRTTCPWKGEASYYHLIVNGNKNEDAAWYYPAPNEEAKDIAHYVAFCRGVEIVPS
jgi:uncharacterized protein (DUF427 family)